MSARAHNAGSPRASIGKQPLEFCISMQRGKLGVVPHVVEVIEAGGDGFPETGQRESHVLLLLGGLGLRRRFLLLGYEPSAESVGTRRCAISSDRSASATAARSEPCSRD